MRGMASLSRLMASAPAKVASMLAKTRRYGVAPEALAGEGI